jgi:hypothetical protein
VICTAETAINIPHIERVIKAADVDGTEAAAMTYSAHSPRQMGRHRNDRLGLSELFNRYGHENKVNKRKY